MKNKGLIITLIIILSLLSISLIIFMVGMLSNSFHLPSFGYVHKVSTELVLDEVYENTFDTIDIKSDASDISIEHSEDGNVRVVVYGDKEKVRVENNEDKLNIYSETKRCHFFCIDFRISKIVVYLPEEYNNEIEINNKYGDIKIGDFSNATIKVDENCGDVKITGGRIVEVSNDFGDVSIDHADSVNVKEDAGDVKIGTVKDVDIKNSYGDIKISRVDNYLNVESSCGDVKINSLSLNKNSSIKNDLGDIEIGSTNEIFIDAKVSLGDIDISHNYNKSDITLKIKNDCGDIKVKN